MLKICLYLPYDKSKSLEKITKQEEMKALRRNPGIQGDNDSEEKNPSLPSERRDGTDEIHEQAQAAREKTEQTKNRQDKQLLSETAILKTTTEETFALLMDLKAMKLPTMQNETAKML